MLAGERWQGRRLADVARGIPCSLQSEAPTIPFRWRIGSLVLVY